MSDDVPRLAGNDIKWHLVLPCFVLGRRVACDDPEFKSLLEA